MNKVNKNNCILNENFSINSLQDMNTKDLNRLCKEIREKIQTKQNCLKKALIPHLHRHYLIGEIIHVNGDNKST